MKEAAIAAEMARLVRDSEAGRQAEISKVMKEVEVICQLLCLLFKANLEAQDRTRTEREEQEARFNERLKLHVSLRSNLTHLMCSHTYQEKSAQADKMQVDDGDSAGGTSAVINDTAQQSTSPNNTSSPDQSTSSANTNGDSSASLLDHSHSMTSTNTNADTSSSATVPPQTTPRAPPPSRSTARNTHQRILPVPVRLPENLPVPLQPAPTPSSSYYIPGYDKDLEAREKKAAEEEERKSSKMTAEEKEARKPHTVSSEYSDTCKYLTNK